MFNRDSTRSCKITQQLIDLARRGYKLPWVREDGIAPFPKMVLEEIMKKQVPPGSSECVERLRNDFKIDSKKIEAAAADVLGEDDIIQPLYFCKISIRALEKEIARHKDGDPEWAEKLLTRYIGCILRDNVCHIESVNDLLTIVHENGAVFDDDPPMRIAHLLGVIQSWKSGLRCGVLEEGLKLQEKYCGNKKVCNDFIATAIQTAPLTDTMESTMAEVVALYPGADFAETAGHLQDVCDELSGDGDARATMQ